MNRWIALVGVAFAFHAAEVPAGPSRAPEWPTRGWTSREAEFQRGREDRVRALDDYLAQPSLRSEAALVVLDGQIVYERYWRGFRPDRKHLTWSVTKSFVNALVGIAVRDGKLSLSDSLCQFFHRPSPYCVIQVGDLLQWSSGIDWAETYESDSSPKRSSVLQMLYGDGRGNMGEFVANHRLSDPPGQAWRYSSGDSNVLSAILKKVNEKESRLYPWKYLFDPIGMKSATWETDASGTFVGSSYLYATARDLAKFGYLYLKDGVWENGRILPEGWVSASLRLPPAFERKRVAWDPGDVPGAHWWLNRSVESVGVPQPWPDAPTDAFAARGHWDQLIVVVPSWNAVIVRLGDTRDDSFDPNLFLKRVGELLR